MAAHAISHQEEVAAAAAAVRRRLRQAGLTDPQRARQIRHQEVILVAGADAARVGQPEGVGDEGRSRGSRGQGGRGGWLVGRGHRSFLTGVAWPVAEGQPAAGIIAGRLLARRLAR